MKSKLHLSMRRLNLQTKAGMALVLVLAFLVLITGLVVAFFSSVTNELSAANSSANGGSAQQLADSAVSAVMAQIRTATSGTNTAWASQPGMIRTYGNSGTASANPLAFYKLYSSNNMVVTAGSINLTDDLKVKTTDDVKDWIGKPAIFTDLNAPVVSGANTIYPIVDPTVITSGTSIVEGFSLSGTNSPVVSGTGTNLAPMPVKWIYVLKDGSLTAPTDIDTTGNVANWTSASGTSVVPSAANPIVGRIAFWTDDETCKLNLNTACGGNPWEPPMFTTAMDYQFSRFGPAKNEFSRYPGHPATTSLLPVFWSLISGSGGGLAQAQTSLFPNFTMNLTPTSVDSYVGWEVDSDYSGKTAQQNLQNQLLLLSPRNQLGGSNLAQTATMGTGAPLNPTNPIDSDRLFASVDEALFGMPLTSGSARPTNPFDPNLNNSTLNKLRFFLTTTSRSPEVNMFNLPKVTMWPEPDTRKMAANAYSLAGATRSPVDQLIAFCSTLNKKPYYFTRYDATSATNDFAAGSRNAALYNYLNGLLQTGIPGFGGKFDGQAGRNGSQILTLAADYIRSDINLLDPNGSTSSLDPINKRFKYSYTTPPISASNLDGLRNIGTGQVVPALMPNGTKGIGRFPTVKSATIMFIARAANQPPLAVNGNMQPTTPITINPMHPWMGAPDTSGTTSGTTVSTLPGNRLYPSHPGMPYLSNQLTAPMPAGKFSPNPTFSGTAGPTLQPYQTQVEAIFFIDPVNVGVGQVGISSDYRIEVDGLNQLQIKDSTGTFQNLFGSVADKTSETAQFDTSTGADVNSRFGGDLSYDIGKESHTIMRYSTGSGLTKLNYWSGVNSKLVVGNGSSGSNRYGEAFDFKGGNITVRIYPHSGTNPVQTLTINFPDSKNGFPTPRLIAYMPVDSQQGPASLSLGNVNSSALSFNDTAGVGTRSRLGLSSSHQNAPGYQFTMPETSDTNDAQGRYKFTVDTLRSVECNYGDTRVLSALPTVPGTFFTPHKFYYDNLGIYTQSTAMWSQPWARSAHTLRRSGEDRYIQSYNSATTGATMQPLVDFVSVSNTNHYSGDYGVPATSSTNVRMMVSSFKSAPVPPLSSGPVFVNNVYYFNNWPNTTSSVDFSDPGFIGIWAKGGDFDTGQADLNDGPYINKPSEGTAYANAYSPDFQVRSAPPNATVFSPNRQVPSSGMFGSLPRGVNQNDLAATLSSAWQTLLFCPNPNSKNAGTSLSHAGMSEVSLGGALPVDGRAPDFLFLDFFHMPVVDPYAISEPFSTAGKVNMNYQIAPFTYITRNTALRGVLDSTLLTAVPDNMIQYYKNDYFSGSTLDTINKNFPHNPWYFRYPIQSDQTLQQFQNRFDNGDIFHSASEICSLFLYPAQQPTSSPTDVAKLATGLNADAPGSITNIQSWWYSDPGGQRKSLTGDNMRERPYTLLYPRLTTKSNSYTVHVRVQRLKKSSISDPTVWDESKDQIASEYRGSTLIERYVDPDDTTLPDFATTTTPLDAYYKFRIVSTKKFTP